MLPDQRHAKRLQDTEQDSSETEECDRGGPIRGKSEFDREEDGGE